MEDRVIRLRFESPGIAQGSAQTGAGKAALVGGQVVGGIAVGADFNCDAAVGQRMGQGSAAVVGQGLQGNVGKRGGIAGADSIGRNTVQILVRLLVAADFLRALLGDQTGSQDECLVAAMLNAIGPLVCGIESDC